MQIAPVEIEEGNIEYKRHFINVNNTRLNHLTAQMNWRINEGNGICYYYLGICDNGCLYENFSQEEIDYSLDIIKLMAEGCNSYIDNIIINRVNNHIWLNITIRRKYEFTTEYRILVDEPSNINKLLINNLTIKSKDIYFNTIFYNNERYLFFECSKSFRSTIENIIDFNLIINKNFHNLDNLMNYVEQHISGNNISETNNNYDIVFNIIKTNYIQSIGYILFGFLKHGTIINGMELLYKNQKVKILSIHNNYIDCNESTAPATISLRINNNINISNGFLFGKSEHSFEQLNIKQRDIKNV